MTQNYQERRCQVGLHNFTEAESFLCERCKCMQLPYLTRIEIIHATEENEITNTFKNMNIGYECRDGTINYNKTWD